MPEGPVSLAHVEVVDHLRVRLPLGPGGLFLVGVQIVDTRNAVQIIECQVRLVPQIAAHIKKPARRYLNPGIDVFQIGARDELAKLLRKLVD